MADESSAVGSETVRKTSGWQGKLTPKDISVTKLQSQTKQFENVFPLMCS